MYKCETDTDKFMISVLLVEDDKDLSELLQAELELKGFSVSVAENAMQTYKLLSGKKPDVIVLDIGLPDESGLKVAKFVRKNTTVGLIMLTALGSDKSRIEGYASGADVYLVKPTCADELQWAIRNLANRLSVAQQISSKLSSCPLGFTQHYQSIQISSKNTALMSPWRFDTVNWTLISPEGLYCTLSGKEKLFLELLSGTSKKPVSRTSLLQKLSYADDEHGMHALETLVMRLRKKIASLSGGSVPIKTVRGKGYQFTASLIFEPNNW
ncbi:response regulator transcription factor [Planctobacterium marinum]|uniref:response regulator transcription factor n=1 Tax=Planctobacterium marinum TaxID=1631968 RepID=UPI001E4D1219|nr:response regulator transcription factor [Planctobacterium marinum]MCC2605072.1 response regulator transcription factor [Planctobacterium marinum]